MSDRPPEDALADAWNVLLHTLGGPPSTPVELADLQARNAHRRPVPVTVLSGFLGAGKTTLLCRLLEQTSLKITAIVNDVASVNVDAARVRSRNAETIEFQNGCACCALELDLRSTLEEISLRDNPPDAVIVEASGIADPLGIAMSVANVCGTTLDGVVTVIDATGFDARSTDPATAALFQRQLDASHLIVLTRTEAIDLHRLINAIADMAPGRPVLTYADLFEDELESSAILLGAATRGAHLPVAAQAHQHEKFAVETLAWSAPVLAADFFSLLDQLPDTVYRIKGWIRLKDGPDSSIRCVDIQAVGRRWRVEPALNSPYQTQMHSPLTSQLIIIGVARNTAFNEFTTRLAAL